MRLNGLQLWLRVCQKPFLSFLVILLLFIVSQSLSQMLEGYFLYFRIKLKKNFWSSIWLSMMNEETLLRASKRGSKTYLMKPICAIGFVTRSLFAWKNIIKQELLFSILPVHKRCHREVILLFFVRLLKIFFHQTFHPALSHKYFVTKASCQSYTSPLIPWLVCIRWRCRTP